MRVVVVGAGSIGSRHARNLKALGCDVTLVDQPESKAVVVAFQLDVQSAYDSEEAMAAKPDAVLICTPAATHAAVAQQLLTCGYRSALFIEKPLALSLEDAEVFRTWPHPVVQVGYNLRFHERARELYRAIAPAQFVECRIDCDMRTWPGDSYAAPILECSHEIDLALACGASTHVTSLAVAEGTAMIKLGSTGLVRINAGAAQYFREWSGIGKTLGYQWSFDAPEELGEQMYVDELASFLRSVESRVLHAPACDVDEALKVLDVCDQVRALAKVAA